LEKITKELIKKYATQKKLSDLHTKYQNTIKYDTHLKNHNEYYSNFIFFLQANIPDVSNNAVKEFTPDFESLFIDELFEIESKELINDFLIECTKYDKITSKLNQTKVSELWIEFGKVMNQTTIILDDEHQQKIIRSFHILYADNHQSKKFLTSTNQTAFRLYLMDKKPINLQFYRTYLYICEDISIFKPPKDTAKKKFHEFNIWLDNFYKSNKLNSHILEDEEKEFYLYLLRKANAVCDVFSSYFNHDDLNIMWHQHRKESLNQSHKYIKSINGG